MMQKNASVLPAPLRAQEKIYQVNDLKITEDMLHSIECLIDMNQDGHSTDTFMNRVMEIIMDSDSDYEVDKSDLVTDLLWISRLLRAFQPVRTCISEE